MLQMTDQTRKNIIEKYVNVYGEKYRERITQQVMETSVVLTYENKYQTIVDENLKEVNTITYKFFQQMGLHINYEDWLSLKYLKEISENKKNGDIECAKLMVDENLYRFGDILDISYDYPKFTYDRKVKYIANNIERINARLVRGLGKMQEKWDQSEESKIVDKKVQIILTNQDRINLIEQEKNNIDNKINKLLKEHLGKRFGIVDEYTVQDYLSFLMLGVEGLQKSEPTICSKFLRFAKKAGYEFESINEFLQNQDAFEYIFNNELISELRVLQDKKLNFDVECSSISGNFKQIKDLNIDGGNARILNNVFEFVSDPENRMGTCMAYVDTDKQTKNTKVKNIIIVPQTTDEFTVFHEFGHAMQTELLDRVGNVVYYRSGLYVSYIVISEKDYKTIDDIIEANKAKLNSKVEDRKPGIPVEEKYRKLVNMDLMALNEVFNEFFSMQATGQTVQESESLYVSAFSIVEKFIVKYKEKIIQCLMGGSIFEFVDYFGEDNLIELNKIINSLFISQDLINSKEKLEKIAKERNIEVEDLMFADDVELNVHDKMYLSSLMDLNRTFRDIDNHISSQGLDM